MIYADEPTGNLDRAGGDRIIHLLRDRQRSANRTLLIVTHDRRFITREDIVLEIEDGRLKDEPSRAESRRRDDINSVRAGLLYETSTLAAVDRPDTGS